MSNPTAPRPASDDEEVAEPLLRDPPSPPGYVNPLEGNAALEALASATRLDEPAPNGQPPHTG